MQLDRLDWDGWFAASEMVRAELVAEAAERVGGTVDRGRVGPVVVVDGVRLALVPGGTIALGWDGRRTALEPKRRALWMKHADFAGSFEDFLRTYLGPARSVSLPPMLVELTGVAVSTFELGADPEKSVRDAVAASGFRLLSSDEWENAARAGVTTLFPWGNDWPAGEPVAELTRFRGHLEANRLGIERSSDPYQVEVLGEDACVRGGDGGTALGGGRPPPEAWYSFALAFQYPRALWEDVLPELYEQAIVRRALSLPADQ